jgi:hypothetical protein
VHRLSILEEQSMNTKDCLAAYTLSLTALTSAVHSLLDAPQVNQLGGDVQGSWHPLTFEQLAQAGPLARSILRLVATTPLKLFSSIGEWVRSMQVGTWFPASNALRICLHLVMGCVRLAAQGC